MSAYNFDIETWNKFKKIEFLRQGGEHWQIDFTEALKKFKNRKSMIKSGS